MGNVIWGRFANHRSAHQPNRFCQGTWRHAHWLDSHNRPLVRLETDASGDGITVKVHFDDNDVAEQFRQAFRGSYAG